LLGHPTFSLSVVLAGLLVSSGAGSFSTRSMRPSTMAAGIRRRFGMLIGVLAVIGPLAPTVISYFHGAATPIRIAVALVLVVTPGYFMGMAFPMAMKMAEARRPSLMAWLWGINGAASICAAVLAVVISSSQGISVAWWTGTATYLLAAALILKDARDGTERALETVAV
jgi:peptidoglycan/LPS O-acetylase OafA/YrhL